ncbi:MAG: GAF and ANTAR domain-containing protein [Actinomycetota bacterium]|nr:GAF and ANTAR domain-containing protein [Actinomycetota bacterium]
MADNRERAIITSFMTFADQLAEDFDILDITAQLAEDCAALLDVAAAGLLLADAGGVLHLLAATSQQARSLEVFQLQREEGPCLRCYQSGITVSVPDVAGAADRWPRFAAAAQQQGFASVHAIPIRLRRQVLGAVGLFGGTVGELSAADLHLAQSLAHVAAIAIAQHGQTRRDVLPVMQAAVASRGLLELAKGVLAEVHNIDMDEAFDRLRDHARRHDERLSDLARLVVSGQPELRQPLLAELGQMTAAPSRRITRT